MQQTLGDIDPNEENYVVNDLFYVFCSGGYAVIDAGKFRTFDLKIINFLKHWRPISRLILDVECSFNHQKARNNVENTLTGLNYAIKCLQIHQNVTKR